MDYIIESNWIIGRIGKVFRSNDHQWHQQNNILFIRRYCKLFFYKKKNAAKTYIKPIFLKNHWKSFDIPSSQGNSFHGNLTVTDGGIVAWHNSWNVITRAQRRLCMHLHRRDHLSVNEQTTNDVTRSCINIYVYPCWMFVTIICFTVKKSCKRPAYCCRLAPLSGVY